MADSGGEWVGGGYGGDGSEDANAIIAARAAGRLEILIAFDDDGYDWEARAIVRVGRRWYLVGASGCSCSNAADEWQIQEAGSLAVIRDAVVKGRYSGYTITEADRDAMLAAIDARRRASN